MPIQSGQGIPSIWVHGAPGDVSWVTRLAEGLGPEHALYGVEARGVHGELAPRRQVSTMVRDYVRSLRRLLPQGPYRLGGYSGGGIIAFEMARELIASGARVDKLVLLDAYAPGNSALTGMDKEYGDGFIYLLAANWFGRNWGMTNPLPTKRWWV